MSQATVLNQSYENQPALASFPCTQEQLRWWILDQLDPGNPAYNVAICWELRGKFKASSIEKAYQKVIERHEGLRTRFVNIGGTPVQELVEPKPFKLSVIDLRGMSAEGRDTRLKSIAKKMARAPFNLEQAELIRASLLLLDEKRGMLMTTAHHIVFDGWSIRILGREIGEISAAIEDGRAPNLVELPLQYGDFALWQKEYMGSCGFDSEIAFWTEKLGDGHYFEVKSDKPRPPVVTHNGDIVSLQQPIEFSAKVSALARQLNVSEFVMGSAVLSLVLHRITNERDISFGIQIAGRDDVDLEHLIGVFINSLVLRIDVDDTMKFVDHVKSVGGAVTAVIDHQRMPFNKLVELLNPVRDASRNPIVSINFNLQKAFLEDHKYGEFDLISAPSLSPGAIYDLNFFMVGRPDGWRLSLEYNSDLFEKNTASKLLQLWQETYECVLAEPEVIVAKLCEIASNEAIHTAHIEEKFNSLDDTDFLQTDSNDHAGSQILEAVRVIWSAVLHVDNIQDADNFFELGGHSLLAMRMISAVQNELSLKTSLATLFAAPTIAEFASSIAMSTQTEKPAVPDANPWDLVTYKKGHQAAVFTLNHPFLYYRLAKDLPDDVAVYNLNLFNTDIDDALKKKTFSELAAQVITIIDTVPEEVPLALIGLCVNGNLAIEVTRQLRAKHRDVRFTGIIDSWEPSYFTRLTEPELKKFRRSKRIRRTTHFISRLVRGQEHLLGFMKRFKVTQEIIRIFGIKAGEQTHEDIINGAVTRLLVNSSLQHNGDRNLDDSMQLFKSQAIHPLAKKAHFGWIVSGMINEPVVELVGWHEDSLTRGGTRTIAQLLSDKLGMFS
ncbi:condensation domain-containing protein [Ahrensia sp. 13_GOM-1096m]|uniref:condensation domain-containing protein n=1 Tax=Ahrensia sp. 13_GOM-1096m TaxID=1380380 RepID=UPI0004796B6F|nr:condensation domain-containing protein [Ahrensia sp. 13_GOM-1096m]